jgi:hypothetical protein
MGKDSLKLNARIIVVIILLISTTFSGIYFDFVINKRDLWLKDNNQGIVLRNTGKTI